MACVCSSTAMAERVSWYCALLLAVLLVLTCCESSESSGFPAARVHGNGERINSGRHMINGQNKPCDEIYVVREGETLQTIAERCGDPYIVEENPHIHDPDDVFPGLVIKITPFRELGF